MTHDVVYDIAGVGIDPFNLGLAALAEPAGLRTIFFDASPGFSWPPCPLNGLPTLQVPFYADLVTCTDPASRYSYLNYLHSRGRLQSFGTQASHFLTRREYNSYCRWVIAQFPDMLFNHNVVAVKYLDSDRCYRVEARSHSGVSKFLARHLVLANHRAPCWPDCTGEVRIPGILHSSDYQSHREKILSGGRVAVVGQGEEAAGIVYDLLLNGKWKISRLEWLMPAPKLYPADDSMFSLELASPDYTAYFQSLQPAQREKALKQAGISDRGISEGLLAAIYGELYHNLGDCPITLIMTSSALTGIAAGGGGFELSLLHMEQEKYFYPQADHVILATGYKSIIPNFLEGVSGRLCGRVGGRYEAGKDYSIDISGREIFVQDAGITGNGLGVADLVAGPYRNAVILNSIVGYERYKEGIAATFQTFGVPG